MTINVISHTQSTHGQVLSPQYHFNNYHFFYYWSVCTKPGKWAVMYMCVKGIDFALFSLEFSINSLELFRPCGILYFFHFIDNKRYYSYPINRLGKEFWYHNTIVYSSHFTAVCTKRAVTCVRGIHFASFSYFLLDLGTVPSVWYFCFSFHWH
jgi:hypothetical protein